MDLETRPLTELHSSSMASNFGPKAGHIGNEADYAARGVPTALLGYSLKSWRTDALTAILIHYGITGLGHSYTWKIDLTLGVWLISQHYGIARGHRINKGPFDVERLPGEPLNMTFDDLLENRRPSQIELWTLIGSPRPRWTPLAQRSNLVFPHSSAAVDTSAPQSRFSVDQPPSELLQWLRSPPLLGPEPSTSPACLICTDEIEDEDRLTGNISAACTHDVETCRPCLQSYITSQMETTIWDQISCPQCEVHLTAEDINKHGNPTAVARYAPSQSY